MMHGIDISNWQSGLELGQVMPEFCIIKATEGVTFVDPCCDGFVQDCTKLGIPWGFYHFAGNGSGMEEAQWFIDNCENYFGHGIPVLDWEGIQDACFVNAFVDTVHAATGVWPWIYANPWRFDQYDVSQNCMRWVASYPNVSSPSFADAENWDAPACNGLVGAWQFCSDGRLAGYNGQLDLDLFYGDKGAWSAYVGVPNNDSDHGSDSDSSDASVLENSEYVVTVRRKN